MRFLTRDDNDRFHITADLADSEIESYAILSHTWAKDAEEVTCHEINLPAAYQRSGYRKIQFCGDQARQDGLQYFWVDTCCIDKANHTELSRAITSMYRWYQQAQVCYVYLVDVSSRSTPPGCSWQTAFRRSRWFTRGWTLQELLAPHTVVFYSKEWDRLGTKDQLKGLLHDITGIPTAALEGRQALSDFPVIERMRWAQGRQTKEKEDQAYCLLGIFGVYMPLLYGEGDNAFRRLQRELDTQWQVESSPESRHSITLHLDPQQINAIGTTQRCVMIFEASRRLTDLQQTTRTNVPRTASLIASRTIQRPSKGSILHKRVKEERGDRLACCSPRNNFNPAHKTSSAFTFRLPLWKYWKCFQISLNQRSQCFGIHLRVYNMRPCDSELFQAAHQQRWKTVYQMLAKHEASIFDVDEWSNTLLHIAASQARSQVCRFLLSNGLGAHHEAGPCRRTPLKALCLAYRPASDPLPKVDTILETARLLMPTDLENTSDLQKELRSWFHRSSLPADCFSMLTRAIFPSYDALDPLWRAHLAVSTISFDPDSVAACLGNDLTLQRAFKLIATPSVPGYGHRQILFNICRNLSRADITDEHRAGWLGVLASVVSFEVNSINPDTRLMYRSLYAAFIANYISSTKHLRARGGLWNELATSVGKIWLQMLVICGADLKRYADAERTVLKNPETIVLPKSRGRWHCHKVKYLSSGPHVDDWQIFLVPTYHKFSRCERPDEQSVYVVGHTEYEMAGDFWHLVENPELFKQPKPTLNRDCGIKSTVGKPAMVTGPIF